MGSVTQTPQPLDHDEEQKAMHRVCEIALKKGVSQEEVVKTYNEWTDTYDKQTLEVGNKLRKQGVKQRGFLFPDINRSVIGNNQLQDQGFSSIQDRFISDNNTSDDELKPGRYNGPMYAARYLHKHLCSREDFTDLELLDVGAGSGRVAVELKNLAEYNSIDALEPARTFFEASPYKTLYRNHICKFLGGETVSEIPDDRYDAIITAGCFAEGHIACNALTEMIRIVKPGGLVVIVMNNTYLWHVEEYKDRLEPFMHELQQLGKWTRVEKVIEPNHFCDKDGAVFVYRVDEKGCSEFHSKVL